MIRDYRTGDHIAIAKTFVAAIYETASEFYSSDQCDAWTWGKLDPEYWLQRCEAETCFVNVRREHVLGFCELDSSGLIGSLFVHPSHSRRGIAGELLDYALERARFNNLVSVYVDASICAMPLFLKYGFRVIAKQTVTRRGVGLTNFKMRLLLE